MKLLLSGRVLSSLVVAAILSGCGGAQSAVDVSGPIQQNAAHSAMGHLTDSPDIPFDVYNAADKRYI